MSSQRVTCLGPSSDGSGGVVVERWNTADCSGMRLMLANYTGTPVDSEATCIEPETGTRYFHVSCSEPVPVQDQLASTIIYSDSACTQPFYGPTYGPYSFETPGRCLVGTFGATSSMTYFTAQGAFEYTFQGAHCNATQWSSIKRTLTDGSCVGTYVKATNTTIYQRTHAPAGGNSAVAPPTPWPPHNAAYEDTCDGERCNGKCRTVGAYRINYCMPAGSSQGSHALFCADGSFGDVTYAGANCTGTIIGAALSQARGSIDTSCRGRGSYNSCPVTAPLPTPMPDLSSLACHAQYTYGGCHAEQYAQATYYAPNVCQTSSGFSIVTTTNTTITRTTYAGTGCTGTATPAPKNADQCDAMNSRFLKSQLWTSAASGNAGFVLPLWSPISSSSSSSSSSTGNHVSSSSSSSTGGAASSSTGQGPSPSSSSGTGGGNSGGTSGTSIPGTGSTSSSSTGPDGSTSDNGSSGSRSSSSGGGDSSSSGDDGNVLDGAASSSLPSAVAPVLMALCTTAAMMMTAPRLR